MILIYTEKDFEILFLCASVVVSFPAKVKVAFR